MAYDDWIKEKEEVQKRIAEESGYDLRKQFEMMDEAMVRMKKRKANNKEKLDIHQ